jgi:hypothetical protein
MSTMPVPSVLQALRDSRVLIMNAGALGERRFRRSRGGSRPARDLRIVGEGSTRQRAGGDRVAGCSGAEALRALAGHGVHRSDFDSHAGVPPCRRPRTAAARLARREQFFAGHGVDRSDFDLHDEAPPCGRPRTAAVRIALRNPVLAGHGVHRPDSLSAAAPSVCSYLCSSVVPVLLSSLDTWAPKRCARRRLGSIARIPASPSGSPPALTPPGHVSIVQLRKRG